MTPRKSLVAFAFITLAGLAGLHAQEQTTAQKTDVAATTAAQEIEAKLESEANATAAPAPAEDPLITQYRLRKDKNFKAVEFELAKELALQRSNVTLNETENTLYVAALQNLTTVFGSVSEPQKEETYFEYQDDPETGEFVVVLVKDSYVKSAKGDVCQIGIQVHLRTSVQAEFSAKLKALTPTTTVETAPTEAVPIDSTVSAAPAAPSAPTNITDIECYNDQRPTYSQRLVQ